MIHVCFGLYDKNGTYSKFTGTTMLSLFENVNTPPRSTTVHILHDNTLTNDNREKFSYVAGQYNQLVKFYNVEELCADKISEMVRIIPSAKTSRLTVGALYRFFIPQLLPADVDKCIYLDSDLIVNLDINELWRIELGDKPLAAADEAKANSALHPIANGKNYLVINGFVDGNDYFNSGVLLMNLNFLREKEDLILDGVKFVDEHPQLTGFDQDVLNYLFSKDYLKLDEKFNFLVIEARNRRETKCHRRIYHFVGIELRMNINDPFNLLWMKYFVKTPWFNEETIGNLYASVQGLHAELKNFAVQVSTMMSGKTRAFFTLPPNVDALKKIFFIRDDEEIILADNPNALQKLVDAMKLSAGKKIFFILASNFPFQALAQAGFVYGRDFLNGAAFLSEAHGVPLDSHSLVKAM